MDSDEVKKLGSGMTQLIRDSHSPWFLRSLYSRPKEMPCRRGVCVMYVTKLVHLHGSACPLAQRPDNTFVKVNLYMDIHTMHCSHAYALNP